MKIRDVRTYLVGNAWKNWLFVRVDTDEGIHGVGEGTLNGFCGDGRGGRRMSCADEYIGLDPRHVELLLQRMVRDVYTDGGQIHMAAVAAIEVACWDIVGKALGTPIHELLGGRVRDRVRVYANGWYRTDRDARRPSPTRAARGRGARATRRSSSTRSGRPGASRTAARRTCRSTSSPPSATPSGPTST